jgi:hypothetical protein
MPLLPPYGIRVKNGAATEVSTACSAWTIFPLNVGRELRIAEQLLPMDRVAEGKVDFGGVLGRGMGRITARAVARHGQANPDAAIPS